MVSKYLLFFIMICSFYPGNCKSPICVRFVNLFAKASRVCDCKYSKGKRGSEEKHENWRSKSRREAWRFYWAHTHIPNHFSCCASDFCCIIDENFPKSCKSRLFLLDSISVFRLLQQCAASSVRDFGRLCRFSYLGIDFITLKVFPWTVQDLIRGA